VAGSYDPEWTSRFARRARIVAVAVLVAAGCGALAQSLADHLGESPASMGPRAWTSMKTGRVGPYVMPGYFGLLSGDELWAANGQYLYLSHDGMTWQ